MSYQARTSPLLGVADLIFRERRLYVYAQLFARKTMSSSCRVSLPPGFNDAESGFQRWCNVLLLDAMQRSSWFQQAGDCATAEQIMQKMPGATGQLGQDLLQILKDASFVQLQDDRYAFPGFHTPTTFSSKPLMDTIILPCVPIIPGETKGACDGMSLKFPDLQFYGIGIGISSRDEG